MKKISEWVDVIREAEKRELSKLQQSYQDYFTAKLKKFGVESPADLSGEKKSEFFSEITKDWEKGQGANEAGKKDVKEFGMTEGNAFLAARAKAIEEGAEEFEFNGKVYQVRVNEEEIKKSDVKKMIQDETKDLEKKVKKAETAAKDAEQKAKDAEAESKSAIKDAEKAQDRAGKGTIENKEDFRDYAMKILKKQHPKDFDEDIANKVIDGLAKDAEKSGDWGSAIGRLNKG